MVAKRLSVYDRRLHHQPNGEALGLMLSLVSNRTVTPRAVKGAVCTRLVVASRLGGLGARRVRRQPRLLP